MLSSQANQTSWARPTQAKVSGWHKFGVDFKFLFLEQLLIIRSSWYFFVIISLLLPLAMVFGFGRIGGTTTSRTVLLYIITGSAIFSVASEGIITMAQRIVYMKEQGRMLYYASLPISKTAFILALISSRLLLNLIGILSPLIIGPLLYSISFDFSLWLLVIIPLSILSLSAIGLAVGSLLNGYELVAMIGNLLMIIFVLASPLFIPESSLLLPLRVVGYLLPPTYAVDALRQALDDTIGATFYLDLFVLLGVTILSFGLVSRFLKWRLS